MILAVNAERIAYRFSVERSVRASTSAIKLLERGIISIISVSFAALPSRLLGQVSGATSPSEVK